MWAPATGGSPRSAQLVAEGYELIRQGRAEDALGPLGRAGAADREDAQAAFYAGVALNRLARPGAALEQIDRARDLGYADPAADFERGWSYFMLGRWQEAVEALRAFDRERPGRGQAHAFLGGAYRALAQVAASEAEFDQAVRLDPRLEPVVRDYRRDIPAGAGPGPEGGAAGAPARPAEKPWQLSAAFGAGYNSDARGFDREVPQGGRVRATPSAFVRVGVDGKYVAADTTTDYLSFGGRLTADTYARRGLEADVIEQRADAEYRRAVFGPGSRLSLTARLAGEYLALDESNYRYQLEGRVGLEWQARPGLTLDGGFTFQHNEYLFSLPAESDGALDRDGENRTVSLGVRWQAPGSGAQLRGGWFHNRNSAHGSDFDYEGNGLYVGASFPLPWKIRADVSAAYSLDRYKNANSAVDRAFPRRDDVTGVTARLTRPLSPRLTLFLEYDYNSIGSNVPFYEYEQHVISSGLAWAF